MEENNNNNNFINDTNIVSLGNYCLTSMILKNNNLKEKSYPFDWMVCCIDNICHSITDSFSQFLCKNNYKYINGRTKNIYYYNNTLKLFPIKMLKGYDHQHHNFLNKDNYDYDYISRCVNRFNELDKCNKIIFVMIQPLYLKNVKNNNTKVNELYNILIKKFINAKVILLVFNITTIDNSVYKETKINNNCYIYELKSKMIIGEYGMMWYNKEGIDTFLKIIKSFQT
jgi:hypothetical protein